MFRAHPWYMHITFHEGKRVKDLCLLFLKRQILYLTVIGTVNMFDVITITNVTYPLNHYFSSKKKNRDAIHLYCRFFVSFLMGDNNNSPGLSAGACRDVVRGFGCLPCCWREGPCWLARERLSPSCWSRYSPDHCYFRGLPAQPFCVLYFLDYHSFTSDGKVVCPVIHNALFGYF